MCVYFFFIYIYLPAFINVPPSATKGVQNTLGQEHKTVHTPHIPALSNASNSSERYTACVLSAEMEMEKEEEEEEEEEESKCTSVYHSLLKERRKGEKKTKTNKQK